MSSNTGISIGSILSGSGVQGYKAGTERNQVMNESFNSILEQVGSSSNNKSNYINKAESKIENNDYKKLKDYNRDYSQKQKEVKIIKKNKSKDSDKDDLKVKSSNDSSDSTAVKNPIDEINKKIGEIQTLLNDPSIKTDLKKQDELLKLLIQLQSLLEKAKGLQDDSGAMAQNVANILSNPIINSLSQQDKLLASTVSEINKTLPLYEENAKNQKSGTTILNLTDDNKNHAAKWEKSIESSDKTTDDSNQSTDKISSAVVSTDSDVQSTDSSAVDAKLLETVQNLVVQKIQFDKTVIGKSSAARAVYNDQDNGDISSINLEQLASASNSIIKELSQAISQGNSQAMQASLAGSKSAQGLVSGMEMLAASLNIADKGNNQQKTLSFIKDIVQNISMEAKASGSLLSKESSALNGSGSLLDSKAISLTQLRDIIKSSISKAEMTLNSQNQATENNANSANEAKDAVAQVSGKSNETTGSSIVANSANQTQSTSTSFESAKVPANQLFQEQRYLDYKDILKQISNGTKVIVSENASELNIKLNPENLGKLSLKLVTENGIVSAKFVAENAQVKKVIEANFNELKQSFQDQGINVGSFSVSVNADGHGSGQQLYYNSKNENKKFRDMNKVTMANGHEADEETSEVADIANSIYSDSNVDYVV